MTKAARGFDFARRERWKVMELLAIWEGEFNSTSLRELFQVTREHASRDIKAYMEHHPENVFYYRQRKAFLPTTEFKPQVSSGTLTEYVALVQRLRSETGENHSADMVVSIPEPTVAVDPYVVRSIICAIRQRKRVSVIYRSWNSPGGKHRYIHPHAIAHSGIRWHCRAYDELSGEFRDFALGRFRGPAVGSDASDIDPGTDTAWNETVTLELVPNPALSESEKDLVLSDYGIEEGGLTLTCRPCMVQYALNAYQVDVNYQPEKSSRPARSQPLVLSNVADVDQYLFALE